MKISTKGRYALRLMIDLAQHDAGGYIPLRDISKRQQISAKYLEQIVVQLSRAGFVISTRGAQGGYQLARQSLRVYRGRYSAYHRGLARASGLSGARTGGLRARGGVHHAEFLARPV